MTTMEPQATPPSECFHCSVTGKRTRNEDYAVTDPMLGMCVADGIGGAPFGDAMARAACCEAMRALRRGEDALGAAASAHALGLKMSCDLESPGSGAALAIAHPDWRSGYLQIAWLGDVLCYAKSQGEPMRVIYDADREGGRLVRAVGLSSRGPQLARIPLRRGDRVLLCTDGVWDEAGEREVERVLGDAASASDAVARLVLGRSAADNATAAAMFL